MVRAVAAVAFLVVVEGTHHEIFDDVFPFGAGFGFLGVFGGVLVELRVQALVLNRCEMLCEVLIAGCGESYDRLSAERDNVDTDDHRPHKLTLDFRTQCDPIIFESPLGIDLHQNIRKDTQVVLTDGLLHFLIGDELGHDALVVQEFLALGLLGFIPEEHKYDVKLRGQLL